MNIPFFDYKSVYKAYQQDLEREVLRVLASGQYILGPDLSRFEKSVQEIVGYERFLGVADGTGALQIGLIASGIGQGDRVFVSSHTYIATASALKFVGADICLADIGCDGLISASSIREKFDGTQTAVLLTQLNGRCCDMSAIRQVCEDLNLRLFEDSAQAFGASFDGQLAGTFGEFGTFSFYPAKTLGAFGDGGGIVCKTEEMFLSLTELRDHGRNLSGAVKSWGFNCRLDNLQAALLDIKLKTYKNDIKRRREIGAKYSELLGEISGIKCPPIDGGGRFDILQNYELQVDKREKFIDYMAGNNIGVRIQWGGVPLHEMADLGFVAANENLPNCIEYFKKCCMLPIYPTMSDEQVEYVIDKIIKFFS
jgi:dTDP-4-amino-4,6-dideoxygalactose transaminase